MSDSYQATYDAVRSRFHSVDVGQAIRDSCNLDASFAIETVKQEFLCVAYEHQRPSAIYRPVLSRDGNSWCALYGTNLMEGVAGFGASPAEAMTDFDKNWSKKIDEPKVEDL